jgi:hypothetical protein
MEDRSWMYDSSEGDPLLYFNQVTQFVEAAKMHTFHMKKKKYVVLVRIARIMFCGSRLK